VALRELPPPQLPQARALSLLRVDRGVATEVTSHRGVDIASVLVGDEVALLARAGRGVVPGADVMLHEDGGAPVAESR
jgi:hypothetical protein